jgi:hypothetical protein
MNQAGQGPLGATAFADRQSRELGVNAGQFPVPFTHHVHRWPAIHLGLGHEGFNCCIAVLGVKTVGGLVSRLPMFEG